ncbi:MAG: DsbA family protein [Succinatimonas sp.]|jgi:thiol:disulfide interchange protein DsbA|nr:DsbA family protein [Succinivibrio sp.]MCI6345921.1 DsbA family protein [Succinatimonas sp.]MCI7251548.1 DsbA family protein [Succinatimonas sp.]MDD6377024.1 DsbA family protein [Succinatimonas sp.]MDD6755734.1 DsbA family protein [Succinatimonas sp.]
MFKFLGKAFTLLVLSIFFISSAQARDYKEGQDYEIRATNKTVEPEIREFFSFFCSHCFAMEKPFSQMAEFFKGKAKFIVNPVGLIGGDVGVESQKAYAVAINLEIENELKEELFNRIHVKQDIPEDHDYFVELFESLGVPSEKYEQIYNSFVTQAKVAEYDRHTKEMKIDAVPEIVVNGKYLVKTDNLESIEDYEALVAYLLTLP